MKNFAETKKCRREVLLNFLDAEQAVCSGCDLCNRRFNLQNKGLNDDLKFSDWKTALKIAEKNERAFTPLQFINKIEEELNLWKGKIETKTIRTQIIQDFHHLKRIFFRLRWKIQKNWKKRFQIFAHSHSGL